VQRQLQQQDNGNESASWLGKSPGGEAGFSNALRTNCVSSFVEMTAFLIGRRKQPATTAKSKDEMRGFFAALRMTSARGCAQNDRCAQMNDRRTRRNRRE
jgi:hypothetical protein